MDIVWSELSWNSADYEWAIRFGLRLIVAAVLTAFIGWERERGRHEAGLRTHMLVGLGAALFTLIPVAFSANAGDLAQVVKGVAAGIGFLGAGAILKDRERRSIQGLTTAASIWLTAAVGVAVGAGLYGAALAGVVIAWFVLMPLGRVEDAVLKNGDRS